MPKGGHFFDAIVRQPPIDDEHLNLEDNLEEFGPISEDDLAYFGDSVRAAADSGARGRGDLRRALRSAISRWCRRRS